MTTIKHPDDGKVVRDDQVIVDDHADLVEAENPKDSYEGRKYEPKIDGPEQASQETDEVYVDPRDTEDLPAGGKNVGDLNAHNLGKDQD